MQHLSVFDGAFLFSFYLFSKMKQFNRYAGGGQNWPGFVGSYLLAEEREIEPQEHSNNPKILPQKWHYKQLHKTIKL